MVKTSFSLFRVIVIVFSTTFFLSCNNSDDIPFPEKELGFSQPVSKPLVFSAPKKLNWDTASRTGVTPVIHKLDIDALPGFSYDSSGFKPFPQAPDEVHFDFNSLPGKDIDMDKLPSQSLDFKTFALGPVPGRKVGVPVIQKDKLLGISDFGPSQGMPAKVIFTLLKSRDGSLWIGSREGLYRYDGEQVQTFIKGSTSNAGVVGMAEDNEGNIWFITNENIGTINIHKGTISVSTKMHYGVNGINKMTLDEAGNIWLYNWADNAFSIINPVAKTYKNIEVNSFLSDTSDLSKNTTAIDLQTIQDDDKNIWITTRVGGVNILNPVTGKIKYLRKSNGLSSDTVTAITKDKNGKIWVGVLRGVDAIDLKNGIIQHYSQLQGFEKSFTTWLYFDNKGYLWRNTANGIELADVKNKILRNINSLNGLSGNVVTSVVQDNSNRIWVATTTGLSVIDQNGETVHPFGITEIVSLKEDGSKNLWVATRNGLFIINPERNKMHRLDKSHGLSDNFVQVFYEKDGNMIVATDGGYNIFDPINKTLLKVGKNEGLINDTIYVSYLDDSGNMWLTGPSKGIYLLDDAKKMILHTDASGGLSDDAILDIIKDKNGLIWLATQKAGINVINPIDGTVKYLNSEPGLRDTCARTLLQDKYGRIWIGTDKGIYVADTKKGTLTTIDSKHGLSDNIILSMLQYNGAVLAGSNYRVNMIQVPTPDDTAAHWKITQLDKSGGIARTPTSWSTDAITHDGKYLWGAFGITVINEMKPVIASAQTNITGVNVLGEPQYFISNSEDSIYSGQAKLKWDSVSGPYNLPVNLTIPYDKNYLQFEFAQTNLNRPDSLLYTYILEGIDKNWSRPGISSSTQNYLNLPSGKYTFKVSSKGEDGKWGTPVELAFTITPPWYQSWWAYTIFALIGLGLLRLYIVYRSRKLNRENRILEEKVEHRTNQLKKSLDDLKSTQSQLIQSEKMASLGELTAGIAHEIQNPLNFVNNFSEVNIELTDELKEELHKINISDADKTNIEQIADNIRSNQEKITFHGKRADGIVKGMLQHSRGGNGQKEPTNLNQLSDEYLRLAYHGLRAKDKSFNASMNTDFDPELGKINVIPQEIGRVILNLITNAFYAVEDRQKQTPTGVQYEPTVSVSTKRLDDKVFVSVKDNGNGIPSAIKEKIFQPFFTTKPTGQGTGLGLSMAYDIIKAHGGELKVETVVGEGTEFIIQLPVV